MSSEATAGQTPDVYGQLHPVETPELLKRKQKEFEEEMEKLSADEKKNILLAHEKCPELVADDFKLMFLRCEVYNADLAAKRYAAYWDKRVELFGRERAFGPLVLDTYDDDLIALQRGFFNVIERDDDRNFFFADPSKQDMSKCTRESMCRAFWYCAHALLEDEELQKKGLLIVNYPHQARLSQLDKGLMKLIVGSIRGCLPIRLSAMHLCHPPSFFRIVFPLISLFLGKRLRKRVLVHGGSQEHVLEKLQTKFGFERKDLPTDIGGDMVLDVTGWLEKRRAAGK